MPAFPDVYQDHLDLQQPQARVNVQASASEFGASSAEALGKVGAGLGDVAKAAYTIDNHLDEANAKELDNLYTAYERQQLHDPAEGYFLKQGRTALEQRQPVEQRLQEQVTALSKSARSDAARLAFQDIAQKRLSDTLTRVDEYSGSQFKVYQNSVDEGTIGEAADNMVANHDHLPMVKANGDTIAAAAQSMADRLGLDGVASREFVRQKVSQGYVGALTAMAQTNVAQAGQLFDSVRGGMTANDVAVVEARLKPARLADEARKKVAELTAQSGGDYQTFVKAADGIEDTELHDEVLKRGEVQFALQDKAHTEVVKNAMDRAYGVIEKGGSIDSVSVSDKALITGAGYMDNLRAYMRNKALGIDGDESGLVTQLRLMEVNDPARFKNTDLRPLRAQLGEKAYQSIALRQANLIKGIGQEGADDSTVNGAMSLASDKLKANGYDTSAKANPAESASIGKFKDALVARLDSFAKANNRQPKAAEQIGIVDDLLTSVGNTPGFFGLGSKPVRVVDVWTPFDKIPPADRNLIVQSLYKHNQPVSRDIVEEVYAKRQRAAQTK